MKCHWCQADNRDEALFCGDCGARLQRFTPYQRKLVAYAMLLVLVSVLLYKPITVWIAFTDNLAKGEACLLTGDVDCADKRCKAALVLKPGNLEAAACAEKAAETLARSREEKRIAEAKAKTARNAAAAKARGEQEAAEAKAKTEREAAEAKAKTEREAAEAKAKAERERKKEEEDKRRLEAAKVKGGNAANCNPDRRGGPPRCNWYDAIAYCKGRLPTVAQLQAAYKAECMGGGEADTCGGRYWSSEESSAFYARIVVFSYGAVGSYGKDDSSYIRCK